MVMIIYAVGQLFRFIAANSNTGASTLNINSIGAKPIVSTDGSALASGSISLGSVVEVFYDGTSFQLMTDANGQSVFSTDITVHGLTVGLGNSSIAGNTAFGVGALGAITTGGYNTAIGFGAGAAITTGAKNTIIGVYDGNGSGLDIRTLSNYIVLADGDTNLRQIIDNNGNVGIGIIPSAWNSGFKALQISSSCLYNNNANDTYLGANFYFDGTNNKYIASSFSTAYGQVDGQHQWLTAPSGTAGNTITFTQSMTLDNSANLSVGGRFVAGSYGTFASPTIQLAENTYGLFVENGKLAFKGASGGYSWWDTTGSARSMTLDEYGILGLGVTPSGWGSSFKAFEVLGGSLYSGSSSAIFVSQNFYNNGANNIYKTTNPASGYAQNAGVHSWITAPSGTAGTAITFTTSMSLDANSNLSIAGVFTGGYSNPAAGTTAMAFGTYQTVKVTPNATATYTSTVPPAGTMVALILATVNSSSYTITFGTGFKSNGTIVASGTGKFNTLSFISDGTYLIELSRVTSI
jgi:hypothetical protein